MSNPNFKTDKVHDLFDSELKEGLVCRIDHTYADRLKLGASASRSEFLDSSGGGSGLMTWLRASERLYPRDKSQSSLLVERIGVFPSSGEIRREVDDPSAVLTRLKNLHAAQALDINEAEGLSLVLTDWRFKLRISTIERVICLRVESRGDAALMQVKTTELLEQIDGRNG